MSPTEAQNLFIDKSKTALSAMQQMDEVGHKLLTVTEYGNEFKGLLSIGDIQRHLVNGGKLETPIQKIQREEIRICRESESREEIKNKMVRYRTEYMPVLTEGGELSEVILWEDIFEPGERKHELKESISGIIMAGGKGTRLQPLTNVIPKPLIPVGEQPIIEHIINWFTKHGVRDLFVSVGYKADMIQQYVYDNVEIGSDITFVKENYPMGSIGSLSLMKNRLNDTVVVSNCDILIKNSLADIIESHQEKENSMTLVSAIKSYDIPYGVVEIGDNGDFISMNEKPINSFWINTGAYVINDEVYSLVQGEMNMDKLIEKACTSNYRVGAFPVSEGSWMDIGEWEEYHRTQSMI